MPSAWSDADAQAAIDRWAHLPHSNEALALRVYSSRLIGRDPSLVLHGGGNTSVKTALPDDTGAVVPVLCVKGSGWDLADIEPPGLPAVRLQTLAALRELPALGDEDMVNAARTRLLQAHAPNPSVEVLLHAFLPATYIDHSHADRILALVDQADAEARCREIFGEHLAVVPYVMPGFALAKLAAEVADAEGLTAARAAATVAAAIDRWVWYAAAARPVHLGRDRAAVVRAARRGGRPRRVGARTHAQAAARGGGTATRLGRARADPARAAGRG
jgi:rhamnose utilization protein RhaD (predicted bifunctional aldolase and dehydrogenase)